MRHLDVSSISDTVGMPMKSGMLQHLQSAYGEAIGEAVKAIIGGVYDTTKAYILQGCVNTGSGNNYNISAGSIFFNDEVYLVDTATFSIASPNVAVGVIATSFYSNGDSADPVEFTDGISRNINQINKIAFAAGLSGSGAADFTNLIDVKSRPQGGIGQLTFWNAPGDVATYFDASGKGIHGLTIGWAIANGANGTVDYGGMFPMPYKASDASYSTVGTPGGSKTAPIGKPNLPNIQLKIVQPDGVTPYNYDSSGGGGLYSLKGDNDNTAGPILTEPLGSGTPLGIMNPYKVALFIQRIQ